MLVFITIQLNIENNVQLKEYETKPSTIIVTVMYDLWIIVIFFAVLYFWYKLHGHINKIVNMVTFSDQSRRLCNLALVLFYILFINSNLCIMTYLWGAPATKFALALKMRLSLESFGSPTKLDFLEYFCRSKFALLMLKCSYFC